MMMIDDDCLAARIENALAILEIAFQSAIENNDTSELKAEIQRGVSEILIIQDEILTYQDMGLNECSKRS